MTHVTRHALSCCECRGNMSAVLWVGSIVYDIYVSKAIHAMEEIAESHPNPEEKRQ